MGRYPTRYPPNWLEQGKFVDIGLSGPTGTHLIPENRGCPAHTGSCTECPVTIWNEPGTCPITRGKPIKDWKSALPRVKWPLKQWILKGCPRCGGDLQWNGEYGAYVCLLCGRELKTP